MQKNKQETPYVGGRILGTIPQDLLESKSLRVGPDESVTPLSDEARQFLEQNGFHKKN